MNADERKLITDLFDRMRGMGRIDKDRDAEALIHQAVNAHPDSLYMMVQTVLIQENALAQSESRMRELEEEIQALQQRQAPAQASSGGGSFLGGLFGGGAGAARPAAGGSVPTFGGGGAPARQSPWGAQAGNQSSGFQGSSTPQQPMAQPAPARSGGGFLAGAMTTAAGVAGGMLAADAIRNMMGGGSHGADATKQASTQQPAAQDNSQTASADNGLTEEDYDIDNADDSGADFGGGDDSMDV